MVAAVPDRRFARAAPDPGLGEEVARATAFPGRGVAETVLEKLAVSPRDAILELGPGSGRVLAALAARARRGRVVGVDPSAWMLRHARLRCARAVREGRVELLRGTSADLSALPDASFDKAVGVHVAGFFADARADLQEVARVMRPGGLLLLGISPAPPGPPAGRPDPMQVDPERLTRALRGAGFREPARDLREVAGRPLLWLLARRAAPRADEEDA